jgi:hypothetical protein
MGINPIHSVGWFFNLFEQVWNVCAVRFNKMCGNLRVEVVRTPQFRHPLPLKLLIIIDFAAI